MQRAVQLSIRVVGGEGGGRDTKGEEKRSRKTFERWYYQQSLGSEKSLTNAGTSPPHNLVTLNKPVPVKQQQTVHNKQVCSYTYLNR